MSNGATSKNIPVGISDFQKIRERGYYMKAWYDGYRFGNADIYCPWDVMNFIRDLLWEPAAIPESYLKNSSDNAIVRSFIEISESADRQQDVR